MLPAVSWNFGNIVPQRNKFKFIKRVQKFLKHRRKASWRRILIGKPTYRLWFEEYLNEHSDLFLAVGKPLADAKANHASSSQPQAIIAKFLLPFKPQVKSLTLFTKDFGM